MKLLVASNNPAKLEELRRILSAAGVDGVELVSQGDAPDYPRPTESGRTFKDNALIKARAGAKHSGLVTVADDSGLAVDELNGMPGPLSARWSGEHGADEANNELLFSQLRDTPDERRGAAFVSVCALVSPDGREWTAEGRWRGRLLREPRGTGGFGYDPLFVPAEEDEDGGAGRTSAELSREEKDERSHRRKALSGLVDPIGRLAAEDD